MAFKDYLKNIHSVVNRLAIVVVVTVFCGIFIFPLFYDRKHAKAARSELAEIAAALASYRSETGKWPDSGGRSVAAALSGGGEHSAFSNHQRHDADGRFLDPWETPYRFFFSQDGFAIQSAGPDGELADGLSSREDDYWYAPR